MVKTESALMKIFRRMGLDSVAWSLRRVHCPVNKSALVLEVGSGNNPYPRSNILCDPCHGNMPGRSKGGSAPDRPTVIALGENLPFKDDSFDFAIASHVCEHSKEPEMFLEELQRVARAGYIETPDAIMERLCPYLCHRLEITDREGVLHINKKHGCVHDKGLEGLYVNKMAGLFGGYVKRNPFHYHVRYYWSRSGGGVKYKILNPEYIFDWDTTDTGHVAGHFNLRTAIHSMVAQFMLALFSQHGRNRNIDIFDYIQCPRCKKSAFERGRDSIACTSCGSEYKMINKRIIDFTG